MKRMNTMNTMNTMAASSMPAMMAVVMTLGVFTLVLSGCVAPRVSGSGEISDVQAYMNAEINESVTEVELIDVQIIPQRVDDNALDVDGTLFFDGKDEVIPEHVVNTYRAYSRKLDSHVFVIHDSSTMRYRMVQNYDVSQEKEEALEMTGVLKALLDGQHMPPITLVYSKFGHDTPDLDDVYKLSADYDASRYIPASPLWILITADASAIDIIDIEDSIQAQVDSVDGSISVDIHTNDNRTITFYKHGQPLIDSE